MNHRVGVIVHRPLRDTLFAPEERARLEALAPTVWTEAEKPLTVEEASALLADCTVGVGSWGTPYPSEALLSACPHLRLWEHAAGTVKHMFGPHLTGRSLTIASCKTAIADTVAELVLGEIIIGLRRIVENAAANRLGAARPPVRSRSLYGATVGIVGASEVGRRVLRLLETFPCRCLLYDPYITDTEARALGAEKVEELTALCARSDVVTLHTPALPATEKLMGAAQFQAMPEGSVFINSARGACVDEAALIAELAKGRLFAFLDVSSPEPAVPDSPLRRLPNVVYTSHLAGLASPNIGQQAVDDIAAFVAGGAPLCVVTADQLDRIG